MRAGVIELPNTRPMQHAVLGSPYRKVLMLQAIATLALAGLALLLAGELPAVSALVGGLTIMAGNLAYAFIARPSRTSAKAGSAVLLTHVLAQLTKLGLILILMIAAFASGRVMHGWLIIGLAVALAAHWFSLVLTKN
jgi:F0F1-type ATP synthase assembly protein I